MNEASRKLFYCYALLEFRREVWGGDLSSSELTSSSDLDHLLTNAAAGVLAKVVEHATDDEPVLVTLWVNIGRTLVSERAREALMMFGRLAGPEHGGFHWVREPEPAVEGGQRG